MPTVTVTFGDLAASTMGWTAYTSCNQEKIWGLYFKNVVPWQVATSHELLNEGSNS